MPSTPLVSASKAVTVFERLGYRVARQRGSHIMMVKPGTPTLVVPNRSPIKQGTLRSLIRLAGMTVEEFCDYL